MKYRTNEGLQRWLTIGGHGSPWTVDSARGQAEIYLGGIRKGEDPAAPPPAPPELKPEDEPPTMRALCEKYQKANEAGQIMSRSSRKPKKPDTVRDDRGRINRHIIPLLGDKLVKDIRPKDVNDFMHAVAAGDSKCVIKTKKQGLARVTGGKTAATRTVGLLGGIFTWAIQNDEGAEVNPVRSVTRFADNIITRCLNGGEYAAFARALKLLEKNGVWLPAVKGFEFLLFSGWRISEVGGLTWAMVANFHDTAALGDSKTGYSIRPVNEKMYEIIRSMPKTSKFVFPASTSSEAMKLRTYWERLAKAANFPDDITPHIFRHSFASETADAGVNDGLIGACIGHKGQGTTSRYIHRADPKVVEASNTGAKAIYERMYPERTAALAEAHRRMGLSA